MVAPRARAAGVVGMDGDEQHRLVALGELAPLLERDEHVALARHQHLVAARGVELVAQPQAKDSTTFFSTVPRTCVAPSRRRHVPGSMTMIGLVGAARTCGEPAGLGHRRLHGAAEPPAPERPRAMGARLGGGCLRPGARRCRAPGRIAIGRLLDGRLLDHHRARHVDDDARLAGGGGPSRNDLMRPTGASPGGRGSSTFTCGRSTNTRLGLVQRGNLELDLTLQADDEPRAACRRRRARRPVGREPWRQQLRAAALAGRAANGEGRPDGRENGGQRSRAPSLPVTMP